MPISWKRTPSEIKLLQRAISHPDAADLSGLVEALDATVQNRLWAEQRIRGKPLETFSEFVLTPSPSGLGVQSIRPLKFLRQLLMDGGYYAEWVEVMERTMRPRGRPRKTFANGDDFHRCYPYPRTRNSRDYMLLALKRDHPAELLNLSKMKGAIRDAAIKAGVIVPARRNGMRYGVCDIEAAKRLHEATKPKLLKELFRELGVDAQCTFIKGLETGLGPDLARRWRTHVADQRTGPGS